MSNQSINFSELFAKTQSGYDVFAHYLGAINIDKNISSPLRNDDKQPSFRVKKGSSKGSYFYKDHATGQKGNAIQFVKELYNLPNLVEAAKQIDADLHLGLVQNNTLKPRTAHKFVRTEIAKEVKPASIKNLKTSLFKENSKIVDFLQNKLSTNFETIKTLEKLGFVQPFESATIRNKKGTFNRTFTNSVFLPAYQYNDEVKNDTLNGCLYRPFDEYLKKQNFGSGVVFGLHRGILKAAKHLVIVEGVTDYLTLTALVFEFDLPFQVVTFGGVSMINEKTICFLQNEVCKKFESVFLCFDTDFEGIKAQTSLFNELKNKGLNVSNLCLKGFFYENERIKKFDETEKKEVIISKPKRNDICDYLQDFGKETFKRLLLSFLPKTKNCFEIKNYLNEVSNQITTLAKNSLQMVVNAPTGTGKTYTFVNEILPTLLGLGKKALFLVPTNSILNQTFKQDYASVVCLSSSDMKEEKEIELQKFLQDESKKVLVLTYDMFSFLKFHFKLLLQRDIQTIVIDEFHEVESAQSYRKTALNAIIETIEENEFQVIFLSATLPMFAKYPTQNKHYSFNTDLIEISRNERKALNFNVLTFEKNEIHETTQRIFNLSKQAKKVMYYHNSISELSEISNNLQNLGLKTLVLSSKTESNEQTEILEKQEIANVCDVILCTKVLESGFNLNDENLHIIYNYSELDKCENSFLQVLGRARKTNDLTIDLIVSNASVCKLGNYKYEGLEKDYKNCFSNALNFVSSKLNFLLSNRNTNSFETVFGKKDESKASANNFLILDYEKEKAKIDFFGLSNHCAKEVQNKRTFEQFKNDLLDELSKSYDVNFNQMSLEVSNLLESKEKITNELFTNELVKAFIKLVCSQTNETIIQFFNSQIKRNHLHSSLVIPKFSVMETSESNKLLCALLELFEKHKTKNEFLNELNEILKSPFADKTFESFQTTAHIFFATNGQTFYSKELFQKLILQCSKTFHFSQKNELFADCEFANFCDYLENRKLSVYQYFTLHCLVTKKRSSIVDKKYLDLCKEILKQSETFVQSGFNGNLDELYEWFLNNTNFLRKYHSNKAQIKGIINTLFFVEKNQDFNKLLKDLNKFYKVQTETTDKKQLETDYKNCTTLDLESFESVLGAKVVKRLILSVLSGQKVKKAYILHNHLNSEKLYKTEISDFQNVEIEIETF